MEYRFIVGMFFHEVVSRISHNEAALRRFTINAVLMDWQTNQLCEQGFGEPADLWMTWHHSGKRTTITPNGIHPIALFQFCQSTEFIKNVDGYLKARLQVAGRNIPLPSNAASCRTQKGFHLFRRHLLTEDFQE